MHYDSEKSNFIDKLLELDDEQIANLDPYQKNFSENSFHIPFVKLPFIDSNISYISLFHTEYQRQILDVRTQVHFLNEQIEQTRYFYKMTFDGNISDDNHAKISQNLNNTYLKIAQTSRTIITKIKNILDQEKTSE